MSGNGNHGTVNGATLTKDRYGFVNKAYEFDGVDDWIKINHNNSFNQLPLAVSFWVYSRYNSDSVTTLVGKYQNASWNGWYITTNKQGGTTGRYLLGSDRSLIASMSIIKDSWNHVLLNFSLEQLSTYMNGKYVNSSQWSGTPGKTTTTYHLAIGSYRHSSTSGTYFSGIIDNLRIYSRELFSQEIWELYNSAK